MLVKKGIYIQVGSCFDKGKGGNYKLSGSTV